MGAKLHPLLQEFKLKKFLGAGFEGTVHVAARDGQLHVLKTFHRPRAKELARNLMAYSERVRSKEAGLFPVTLIADGDFILGLYYEYMPLYRLPFGGRFSERISQALFAQYCHSQGYLMREHLMYMVDDAAQFLLSKDGHFYYVDYGKRIVRSDDEFYMDRGYAPFSFMEALLRLNGIALDRAVLRPGFDYDRPCGYVRPEQYDALARGHPWTAEIVEMCRDEEAEMFLDPALYERIAHMFPRTVDDPRLFVLADKLIFQLIRVLRMRICLARHLRSYRLGDAHSAGGALPQN